MYNCACRYLDSLPAATTENPFSDVPDYVFSRPKQSSSNNVLHSKNFMMLIHVLDLPETWQAFDTAMGEVINHLVKPILGKVKVRFVARADSPMITVAQVVQVDCYWVFFVLSLPVRGTFCAATVPRPATSAVRCVALNKCHERSVLCGSTRIWFGCFSRILRRILFDIYLLLCSHFCHGRPGAPFHYHNNALNTLAWGMKRWFLLPPVRCCYVTIFRCAACLSLGLCLCWKRNDTVICHPFISHFPVDDWLIGKMALIDYIPWLAGGRLSRRSHKPP